MNWGTKIILLYSGFIVMILALVFGTTQQNIQLVSDDYYEQELKYQDKIDAFNNSSQFAEPITISAGGGQMTITYPKELAGKSIKGGIVLLRPSDSSLDMKTSIQLNDSTQQTILSDKFKRGLYKVQISWTMEDKQYYFEESVFMK